ncbi:hypothetical protein QL285_045481 [Trifolium repens]|nr:hypothetical protein QL285_045481 [Trifolium repens]
MGLKKASHYDKLIAVRCEDSVQFYNRSCAFHQLGRQVKSSCCDVHHRAAMNRYFADLFLLISWRTSSSHRGTMGAIVPRWNAQFLHFLGFFLSFCILDSVLMLFPAFVGFSSYLGLSWSFYH